MVHASRVHVQPGRLHHKMAPEGTAYFMRRVFFSPSVRHHSAIFDMAYQLSGLQNLFNT